MELEVDDKVRVRGSDEVFTIRQDLYVIDQFSLSTESAPTKRTLVAYDQVELVEKANPFGNGWPRLVYHYRSLDTMMKIIDTGQIWATNTNYLNDTQERKEFLYGVTKRLSIFAESNTDYDKQFSSVFEHDRPLNYLPFAACFSRESDSLYQWRAYCPSGLGVSIGFRTVALRHAKLDTTCQAPTRQETPNAVADVHFSHVHYLPNNNADHIDAALRRYWIEASMSVREGVTAHEHSQLASANFVDALERTAALYKNAAFELEREFRLLVPSIHVDNSVIRARQTRSSLAPYVALDVPSVSGTAIRRTMAMREDTSNLTRWDAIERVVVGPTIDKHLTKRAVQMYLSSRGVQARVDVSQVPFRDW